MLLIYEGILTVPQIGLDRVIFSADIDSPAVHQELLSEIEFTSRLEVKGFPTLVLEREGVFTTIIYDYADHKATLDGIKRFCQ
ncbi:MAG: hypothetical protein HOP36_01450 [Methyloglobulus sp.]|nr:hypothetical protein [Methyloglobulus sp.]